MLFCKTKSVKELIIFVLFAFNSNLNCFDSWLKRSSKGTDFILPNECCNMINTVIELKASILKLCTKDTKGEDMVSLIVVILNMKTLFLHICVIESINVDIFCSFLSMFGFDILVFNRLTVLSYVA